MAPLSWCPVVPPERSLAVTTGFRFDLNHKIMKLARQFNGSIENVEKCCTAA